MPPSFTDLGLHSFGQVYFFLLDAPKAAKPAVLKGDATPARRRKPSRRDEHVWDVQARLKKYTDFKVIDVRMRQDNNIYSLHNYIAKELSSKTEDDLVVFYYYGQAGDKGRDYSWRFDGPRHVNFNAYDIFKLCGASGVACMFLLDCDIPTIWEDKLPTPKGHVSIFARGGQLRKPSGEIEDDDADFTENFTDNLSALAQDTDKGKHELRTIPELLTPMQAKPTWSVHRVDKVFKKGKKPTMNIVVDPERVRQNMAEVPDAKFGEVEFFLSVREKGDKDRPALVKRSPAAPIVPVAVQITAPVAVQVTTPAAVQFTAPAAIMVAPLTPPTSASGLTRKRDAKGTSGNDEGYDSESSDGSSAFVSQKRRRAQSPSSE